jgi:DNA-nicking Smr family endonuclease
MSKRRKDGEKDGRKPPRLQTVIMEDEELSRDLFLHAMAELEGKDLPDKDAAWEKAATERLGGRSDKKSSNPSIDLHGLTLDQAKDYVSLRLDSLLDELSGQTTVTIITGKGKHSGPGGSVLAKEIHRFVRLRYESHIVYLEESPADLVVGQFPLRGHFRVSLRRHNDRKKL